MNQPIRTLFTVLFTTLFSSWTCSAEITVHGSTTAYQETGGDWLSMGINDIDASGGLGSDGYLFIGDFDGRSENNKPYLPANYVVSLPGYVSGHAAAGNFGSIADEFSSYGMIDDPNLLNGTNSVGGVAVATGGAAGDSLDMITFTVSGLVPNQLVRVGVLNGVESSTNGRWDPTSVTLSDGARSATVGHHTSSPLPLNPGGVNAGWVFFDLDADGVYTVSATKRLNTQGTTVSGLTFDSIIASTQVDLPYAFTDGNGEVWTLAGDGKVSRDSAFDIGFDWTGFPSLSQGVLEDNRREIALGPV